MTRPTLAIRARRKRIEKRGVRGWWFRAALIVLTLVVLVLGVLSAFTALAFAENFSGRIGLETPELSFIQNGREAHIPVRFYDRDHTELILEALHPQAGNRRWYNVDPDGPIVLPEHVIQSSAAAQEGDFWESASSPMLETLGAFTHLWLGSPQESNEDSIVGLLVDAQVLPISASAPKASQISDFQRELAAIELSARYSRPQLIEFFLNTADYGNLAYGIDAAALVYLGKHAAELTLAESALLAPIPFNLDNNPIDSPETANRVKRELLIEMREKRLISRAELRRALAQQIQIIEHERTNSAIDDFLLQSFQDRFGGAVLGRNGLEVITTVDSDLQAQSECVLAVQIARLNTLEEEVAARSDGSICLASSLLPPLRPGDAGLDHQVTEGAMVIVDAASGEILSLSGDPSQPHPMGSLAYPFVYLTAFAEGYAPGSMVMDLPGGINQADAESVGRLDTDRYHGPVRIRTALANAYNGAAQQMVELVGVESVLATFETMGVQIDREAGEVPGDWEATLLDLTYAASAFAQNGVLTGLAESSGSRAAKPVLIREVLDARGRIVVSAQTIESSVLSDQLAFMVTDVLSDESARGQSAGDLNALEINRPAGALASIGDDGRQTWALGYTPAHVVGIWMGNAEGGSLPVSLTVQNSAAPVWHAVMKYSSRSIPAEGWAQPEGVERVEVCDPSGLLPTVYCPQTVSEPFISGTEPTTFDNLYQPYLINRETGKLATLSTPVELVQEVVFLVPPPEARVWAAAAGIEQPPQEYDTLTAEASQQADLRISSPAPFGFLSGTVRVRGFVAADDLDFYRLQIGKGLNPQTWIQLGEDGSLPVRGGVLTDWETDDLEGLYTLQLVAVDTDGQVQTAVVQVTIDNEPPQAQIVFPDEGEVYTGARSDEVIIQVEAKDNVGIERVEIYVDDELISVHEAEPYSVRWEMLSTGEHEVGTSVYDLAGNSATAEPVEFTIQRP